MAVSKVSSTVACDPVAGNVDESWRLALGMTGAVTSALKVVFDFGAPFARRGREHGGNA